MIYIACILGYLLLLIAISVWKSRGVKDQNDFALAGRSLSPWVMVCTMLAVWIGTGSILGNAEQTYQAGVAALILPTGTVIGMILLSFIARRVRVIEASTVPDVIYRRFGPLARGLAMASLVVAYMVIVSYQLNAGGAVLEVIAGDRAPVKVSVGDPVSRNQLARGRLVFTPDRGWKGETRILVEGIADGATSPGIFSLTLSAGPGASGAGIAVREGHPARLKFPRDRLSRDRYVVRSLPERGSLDLVEPLITAQTATVIAAVFIILYASLAGLMSLAGMDVVNGSIIMLTMVIALPIYWVKAGGWAGIESGFLTSGRAEHLQFWGRYSATDLVNYILPVFLLVLGDANQYQRIFASRTAQGARTAVSFMIVAAYAVELLIIACAWVASSMTPDAENGRYILLHAGRHYLALPMGCLFMVTVVAIIISTADSFLHVPAATFVNDLYLPYINPRASQRRIVWISRLMVVIFGIIAYLVTLAFSETTGFFRKALYAFTIYGSSVTPSLVAAIVWKRATRAGAVSSIFTGMIVTLVWSEADFIRGALPPALSGLDAVLPAILLSVACLVAVSLLTRPPSGSHPPPGGPP